MSKQVIILLILLSGLTSLVALWQIQIPKTVPLSATEEAWQLPSLPQMDIQASRKKLNEIQLWGSAHVKITPLEQRRLQREEERKKKELEQQQQIVEQKKQQEKTQLEQQQQLAAQQKLEQQQKLKQRFIGIIQQGQEQYILLLDDQNKPVPYRLGSTLPYGVSLLKIQEDFIEVMRDKELEIVRLY